MFFKKVVERYENDLNILDELMKAESKIEVLDSELIKANNTILQLTKDNLVLRENVRNLNNCIIRKYNTIKKLKNHLAEITPKKTKRSTKK
jgi:hypothetical protein